MHKGPALSSFEQLCCAFLDKSCHNPCPPRGLLARREREAKELAGAVQQVEVAEGALRDSHATASRLLQECTSARHANQELTAQVKALTRQLEGAAASACVRLRCFRLLFT